MALSRTGFRRVAGATLIGLGLAGCASNPHQQGEARGLQAAAVTYGAGKLAGLSDGDAAAVGGLVGLGVGAIAERNEPDCYSVLQANHQTLTQNGMQACGNPPTPGARGIQTTPYALQSMGRTGEFLKRTCNHR